MDIHTKNLIQKVKHMRQLQQSFFKASKHSTLSHFERYKILEQAKQAEKEVDLQIEYMQSDYFIQELPF
jgi:hypothetical protein